MRTLFITWYPHENSVMRLGPTLNVTILVNGYKNVLLPARVDPTKLPKKSNIFTI